MNDDAPSRNKVPTNQILIPGIVRPYSPPLNWLLASPSEMLLIVLNPQIYFLTGNQGIIHCAFRYFLHETRKRNRCGCSLYIIFTANELNRCSRFAFPPSESPQAFTN